VKRLPLSAGLAIASVLLVGIVLLFALPRHYQVERSIVVAAPVEEVFDQVNDLEKTEAWSPWKATDQTLVYTYGDKTVGAGASYTWTGRKSSGRLEVVVSEPYTHIENAVHSPDMGETIEHWTFEETGDGVVVTWSYSSETPGLMGGVLTLAADRLVGAFLNQGLHMLKREAEAQASRVEPASPRDATLSFLDWLVGCWHLESEGRAVEECWAWEDDALVGTHRDVRDGALAFQETLRIEVADEGVRYVASPQGQATATFPLTEIGADEVWFANPEHDFPQWIRYTLDKDTLTAEVGAEGAETRTWRFTRREGR
jgi:ribosome-associated toxin RatA of RatAB toxin-antitoxin module